MKPVYVVFLMGAAAIGGGLVVRYTDHPVLIALARSTPPTVVAPPVPPAVRMGPSTSVPVRTPIKEPQVVEPPAKPSALSVPVHVDKPERAVPSSPPIVARVRIPTDAPAVVPLERSRIQPLTPVPSAAPKPVAAPAVESPVVQQREVASVQPPTPLPAPPPPQPEPNRVTLRSGMLLSVRINDALSTDRNVQGDVFTGTLDRPLVADGFVIAERGARVRGEVMNSRRSGRAQGMGELTIQLKEISTSDGQRVHIVTQPWHRQGATGGDLAKSAVIPPATSIPFRLDQTVEITERR